MKYVKLNNGVRMPQLGLGTFQSSDAAQCEQTVLDALGMGYRLIDTAQAYGNERFIGNALARTDVPREELFVVTKVWFKNHERCRESVEQSMKDLQVDYLDLVLIPKTTSRDRLRENIDIFDFELSAGEMQTLARMDKGQPMIGNPQNPALVEMSAGW